ncbi:hypothetical protein ACQY0O_006603 [Thecaphora frezii]
MTAATASSSIPAEIRFDPFGPYSPSGSRIASTFDQLTSQPAALRASRSSDGHRSGFGGPEAPSEIDGSLYPEPGPSSSPSLRPMRAPAAVAAAEQPLQPEAGPSRPTMAGRRSGSEDNVLRSTFSDSTVASPVTSTLRAASPALRSAGHNSHRRDQRFASTKGKARASEEQLAGLDGTELPSAAAATGATAAALLPNSAMVGALQAQDAALQWPKQPLLQVVADGGGAGRSPYATALDVPPDPPQASDDARAEAGQAPAFGPGPSARFDDKCTPTARMAEGDAMVPLRPPYPSRTPSVSNTNFGSDGEYEDAWEDPLVDEDGDDAIQRELAEAERASCNSIDGAEAAAVPDDSNEPVSTGQTDISRTPSTSTTATGSSHASSLDTIESSMPSTAASSCAGQPDQRRDTLKVEVDGSHDAPQTSPISLASDPEAAPMPSSSPIQDEEGCGTFGAAAVSPPKPDDASDSTATAQTLQQHDKAVQAKMRRYAALLELVETERNYADDLATLVLVFFDNLCTMPYFEDQPARHALVVRNSEDLLRLHQRLSARMDGILSELGLRKGAPSWSSSLPSSSTLGASVYAERVARTDLEKALSPEADEAVIRVAKLFTGMGPSLQGYKAFCSRHGEALALIREAEKRHADWDAFERRCSDILKISRAPSYGPGASRPASGASTPALPPASNPMSYFTPITTAAAPPSNSSGSATSSAAVTPGSMHSAIRQNSSRLLFRDFLIKPIQRLCLYPLVLQTLLKHTPSRSAGSSELAEAVALMRDVADQVDEAGRQRELELMADLIASRVEPHHGVTTAFLRSLGECRLAGTLDVLHHHRTLDPLVAPLRFKYLGVFLYDGFVLMVKVKKAPSYECRQWFPLWAARLSNIEEGSNLLPHSFRLSVRNHHFEIAASNARERQVWIDALANAISTATVSPPGTEASFPSSLFLGDGSDSDSNSAAATPNASRGVEATSYWDMVKDTVGDPLMEFFANHAACATATAASASTAKGNKSVPAAAAAAAASWIPTEILLRHASPSSRSIVDRGMVFSDTVLGARSSKEAGDLSSLWLPHNPTIGSAVGTAIGFNRRSSKDTSTVKIQRRKSCVESLESPIVAGREDNPLIFTATVMQPGSKVRSSTKSIAAVAAAAMPADLATAGDTTWKSSLRKKANKVRPPSIFAPNSLTVVTGDLASPESPQSAHTTPASPAQSSRELSATSEFGVTVTAASPGGAVSQQPFTAPKPRHGSEDLSVSSASSPRSGHQVGLHSGLNSAASSIANLRSAAADSRRRSSIYNVRDTLSASFGARRSRTRSVQTDVTDLSAEAAATPSRDPSPMNSTAALHEGAAIEEQDRLALDPVTAAAAAAVAAASSSSSERTGRWMSGSRSSSSRPSSLRRALTNASFSARQRTQSDVGMVAAGQEAAVAAGPPSRRLERSETLGTVPLPVDKRRGSGGSGVSPKKGLQRRAAAAEGKGSLGNSLRRSRTMLSTGRAWFGSLSSSTTTGVERIHAEKAPAAATRPAIATVPDGVSPKSSPSLAVLDGVGGDGYGFARPVTPRAPSDSQQPLSQCRSFTEPELTSLLCEPSARRGREVTRSESAPAVPVLASTKPSPKRGSKMIGTLRFLQSNRLSPVPLKAVAETSVEHAASGSPTASPAQLLFGSRHASPRKGRSSLPARLSLLDNQAHASSTGSPSKTAGRQQ